MKQLTLLLTLLVGLATTMNAQNDREFFKTVAEIERNAKLGINDGEYKPLLKAIKLLLDNDHIRSMSFSRDGEAYDYFNPYTLIEFAKKYARTRPKIKRKLRRYERKLRKIEPMNIGKLAPKTGDVRIPGAEILLFKAQETQKRMQFIPQEDQYVIMEFQLGQDIGIRAIDARDAGKVIAEGKGDQVKRIEFSVKKGQTYYMELYNNNGKSNILRLAAFSELIRR
ncbi:MAG: hypothetical protein AAFP19_25920 [Bacteroidota bacterium]